MSTTPTPLTATAPSGSVGDKIRSAFAIGKMRWGMLALVFFATTLNYIDRAALGVMQPVLAKAMDWTAQDYANINFWFQVGYAIGFAAQGRFIDMVGVKRAFALAVLLWSIAAAAHGLAASVVGFMVCRFFLGLAEAANYPSCVKTTRLWFPAGERAMATGIFNAGTNVGAMLTPLMLPFILSVWGWQAAFYTIGSLGAVWLVFWLRNYYNPEEHPRVSQQERDYVLQGVEPAPEKVPYSRILTMRGTWAFALAFTITAPVFWFYLYWLPPFLNQQYHLGISVTQMGLPLMVIYLMADVGSIGGGALSSFMIGRGMAPVRARLVSMLICALCISSIVLAAGASSLWMAVLAISVAIGAHQAWTANIWSLVMDYTPKHVVSSVFGFGGMMGAVGGMFMTQLVGYVLTTTHNNYAVLFTMIPAAYFIALAWLYFMAPRQVEDTAA
ncbi:MFS transporter [Pseudogulbenkiania subflava]|uniref:MFS transporter, ACS family, hexuronate transporter n=1 Tax=Pseudogulbenkiania subflava DSM 22618 TaxID=1123014 RepID=A0A1Y6B7R6_9NEIS|nr:MFS transporter [Pseudogulbenkiania subflava]SME94577.1 MFS transporter, ACS family, hexuronate transporter [Pseudogulbenkiania subflava DSM 22618]